MRRALCVKRLLMAFAAAGWIAGDLPAKAKFVQPQSAPVERLLHNAQAYRDAHPADADACYTLARIHYLAFSAGSSTVPALKDSDDGGKPSIPDDWMIGFDLYEARQKHASELAAKDLRDRNPKAPSETLEEARGRRGRQLEEQNWRPKGELAANAMLAHATAAVAGFRDAMRLDPKNGLYPLGMACLSEEFADWNASQKPANLTPELRALNHAAARAAYLQAFRLAITGDARLPELPATGIASLISKEAGDAFVRLAERDHARLGPGDRAALAEVKAGLAKLKKIRLGAITPIVFSLHPPAHLRSLLAPRKRVAFDLRGYGRRERWPWVKPGAAFLVWDPESRGNITSARQLFGGYTFEIFRKDGFEALAALDNDGDGQLTGDELQGVRVWIDANGDGQCEPCEVHDLCEFGITSIAVRATSHDGPHPANLHGIALRDGGTLPMWDWIARPVRRHR
jgi:hypothetical protein